MLHVNQPWVCDHAEHKAVSGLQIIREYIVLVTVIKTDIVV